MFHERIEDSEISEENVNNFKKYTYYLTEHNYYYCLCFKQLNTPLLVIVSNDY